MRYLLAVNRTIRGKLAKDATPAEWARYNDAFQNVELTIDELANVLYTGWGIAPQCYGRRKLENWRLAQHVGIDLDDGSMTFEAVLSLPLVANHAAIVYTTANHTPEHPRLRVIYLLDEPLRDPAGYGRVVRAMMRAFGAADPQCKDPARLFFGAHGCEIATLHNTLSPEDVAQIVLSYPDDAPPAVVDDPRDPRPPTRLARPPAGADVVPPDRISARRLEAHSDALLHRIATAPDGTKWATLRDIAITFGGYVAGGYYSHAEARRWLRTAIEGRRATVASMAHAYKTIDLGLAYGALSPLYYTRAEAAGAPPAVATRAELRHALIADRLAELERLINAADIDAADFPDWIEEYDALQKARP